MRTARFSRRERARIARSFAAATVEMLEARQLLASSLGASDVNFNYVGEGHATTKTLALTNLGHAGDPAITIDDATITGSGADRFSIVLPASGLTLQPGQSANVGVTFTPNCLCPKTATLQIDYSGNAAPLEVPVSGQAVAQSIGFGKSMLNGVTLDSPTSLQFGPDGRLYVAQQNGQIKALTISRTAANQYNVTASETIDLIKNIQNHNDNGAVNSSVVGRLVTGIYVTGTANQPVIYAVSADPRIGGGSAGIDTNLDTNSGILSRLTKSGGTWTKLDLVRGLPRSEENHTGNGITISGNMLYIAYGGNTNMGAPSHNFSNLPEYALSAAILSVDLSAIGNTTYDLPTLDDESRAGANDLNDPFGGNDGRNQAKLVAGGPVQVYAPGFRNPYDVIITQAGKMYAIDNGANSGWGDVPVISSGVATTSATAGQATNNTHEPGITKKDNLKLITAGYYGGHPNPTRASSANKFNNSNPQSPISSADARQGYYNVPQSSPGALATFSQSTNGLTEYTTNSFGGAMQNHLLAASFDNKIYDIKLNADGAAATVTVLFSAVGDTPLDVTSRGDGLSFAGSIWVADHVGNKIFVFEPNDFVACTGADDANLDEDGDGFDNHDEILNGTSPCSSADMPADHDGDFNSDLLDSDDDNDGILDKDDPFAIDPKNGRNTKLPLVYDWENDGSHLGGFLNLGFTGLMTNGATDYLDQFNQDAITAGGAAGVLTVDEAPAGTAFGSGNDQLMGLQFGIDVDASTAPFVVETRLLAPFAGAAPQDGQRMGLFVGTGDQDNFIELALDGDGTVKLIKEIGGVGSIQSSLPISFTNLDALDLRLHVNTAGHVSGTFIATINGVAANEQSFGTAIDVPPTWFIQSIAPAAGIIATRGANAEGPAVTWDFVRARLDIAPSIAIVPQDVDFGAVANGSTSARTVTLKHMGIAGDPNIIITSPLLSGPDADQFAHHILEGTVLHPGESLAVVVDFNPTSAGGKSASLDIQHSGAGGSISAPLAGLAEVPGNGSASVSVTPGTAINASTYNPNSFVINNTSPAGVSITKVSFDLRGALLPDLVFDPNGVAGDVVAKGFTPDSGAATVGYTTHALSSSHDDGFDLLDINFNSFGAGKQFGFSIDCDPTSIRGASAPGPNEAGSVSGIELIGSKITITFSDGTVREATLYREGTSQGGGKLIARAASPAAPSIQMLGVASTPATTASAGQIVRVFGVAGANVRLLIVEGGLYTSGPANGGFDIDPFEANSAVKITELSATIGAGGSVDVAVTLTKTDSSSGLNHIIAVTIEADGRTSMKSNKLVVKFNPIAPPPPSQQPFKGTAFAIGATIQAEDYDLGGSGVAFSDTTASNQGGKYRSDAVDIETETETGGGFNVAYTVAGEWFEYTINVPTAGTYQLQTRVANIAAGGKFHAEFRDPSTNAILSQTRSITVPKTGGWHTYSTVNTNVTLQAGVQVVRIAWDTNASSGAVANFNWMKLNATASNPPPANPQQPFKGSPFATGATIEAEDYDSGGSGVAFSDKTSTNQGGKYRSDAVDIETTTDAGGGFSIGYTVSGEWLEYTINIATAGNYQLQTRVANIAAGGKFHAEFRDQTTSAILKQTGAIAVPNTGGWHNYTTVNTTVALTAGIQVLRIALDTNAGSGAVANLNWLKVNPV